MASKIHYLGIRHHGPGSARQVVNALQELQPDSILIEGACDQNELIPFLGEETMKPPVALLSYPKDNPNEVRFWPFAEFSPEYQAIRWGLQEKKSVRFIDLPSSWQAPEKESTEEIVQKEQLAEEKRTNARNIDPIGELAKLAGYEDGESWWNEILEENPAPGPVFEAVGFAMEALRENESKEDLEPYEAAREAHMRIEIQKENKTIEGVIVVVCGAYHVPALKRKHTIKEDRLTAKSGPKLKMLATWAPWTSPRLSFHSGYGAGVLAPRWYLHLWRSQKEARITRWLVEIARTLRDNGSFVPSASIIEAERLAVSLAILRNKAVAGYEEMKEASIACLCFGESALWQIVEAKLLLGDEVGEIPDNVPLSPLMEDLKLMQKKTRLKPEALERKLSLDLRSNSGLLRSTLLHQLTILDIPWGSQENPGKSRGTFRENWILCWKPEYAVALVENLVYGPTIAQAATGKLSNTLTHIDALPEIAELIINALTAQLPDVASLGIDLLREKAAKSYDCLSLLHTLEPLSHTLRYGEARAMNTDQLHQLFSQIAIQGSLAIPYASHQLDYEAAVLMKNAMLKADKAIQLICTESSEEYTIWVNGLKKVLSEINATKLVIGSALQILYEGGYYTSEKVIELIKKQLSPGTMIADAASFFEGFFDGIGTRLIHDQQLREAVNDWIMTLEKDTFTENLPIFRRVFSSLDATERTHLFQTLFRSRTTALTELSWIEGSEVNWHEYMQNTVHIFNPNAK